MEIQGYDAAQMVKAAKRAGLSALAALPVEMFTRKRAHDDLQARHHEAPATIRIPVVAAAGTVPDRTGAATADTGPTLPAPREFGPRGLPVQQAPARHPTGHVQGGPREPGDAWGPIRPARSTGRPAERGRPRFLVEPEPAGTFGTDELTAPPVIGRE